MPDDVSKATAISGAVWQWDNMTRPQQDRLLLGAVNIRGEPQKTMAIETFAHLERMTPAQQSDWATAVTTVGNSHSRAAIIFATNVRALGSNARIILRDNVVNTMQPGLAIRALNHLDQVD
jgi:hypothetical protein